MIADAVSNRTGTILTQAHPIGGRKTMDQSLSKGPTVRGGRGPKYPESDGKPMGETGVHVNVMLTVLWMLRRHYANARVAVLANMFLYYEEGDPKKVVCPDVFVILNVPPNTMRRTFKVWYEGKGPDVVIEITSKKTRKEDLGKKFDLYRDVLKVREYFLFDPLDEYLDPSLQGFRLVEGRYEPIAGDESGLFSEVLGLRLERDEMDLRFFNLATGRRIPTPEELGREAQQAQEALHQAEAEVERLRREREERLREALAEVERLRRKIEALNRRLTEDEA
jgi:Uma2 family endonuclease